VAVPEVAVPGAAADGVVVTVAAAGAILGRVATGVEAGNAAG
jgi:hypothetical protein